MDDATAHAGPSRGFYLAIFVTLLVLTGATVAAAFVNLGPMNNVVMLSIAVAKGTLVILFFMHVAYGPRLVWALAGLGFAWLMLMIGLTLADYFTRVVVRP